MHSCKLARSTEKLEKLAKDGIGIVTQQKKRMQRIMEEIMNDNDDDLGRTQGR